MKLWEVYQANVGFIGYVNAPTEKRALHICKKLYGNHQYSVTMC